MTHLYLFVEGMDDIRFFESVLVPSFEQTYDTVHLITYAGMKAEKLSGYIKAIRNLGDDYLLVADKDTFDNTGAKKTAILHSVPDAQRDRIMVVITEIEGWYLAGISDEDCERLSIPYLKDTNALVKEQFNTLIPNDFDSRIDFMIELLQNYCLETAVGKNKSFKYFFQHYLDETKPLAHILTTEST